MRNQLDPNNSFVGLAAGDYNVRVEDSNGCGAAATQSATINPDLDFNINLVTLLDCVPNEGEYEIAITSGSNGDYTFDIQDSVPASVDNGTITAGNTTGNFNIPAGTPGTYSVIVTDVNSGCSITKPLVVAAAVVPTFTGAEVDAICEGESNGRIDITTTAGVIPVTYVATTNPGGVVTGSWDAGASAITGLPAGTYDVIGTGANGCTSLAQTFTIDDYDAVFVPALTVNAFNCTAGTNTTNSATLVFDSSLITGGSGNYTIALFDTNGTVATGNDTAITSGLSISGDIYTYTITDETGDDYYIRVVDNAGCENVSVSATLPAFERLTDITANLVTELDCNNEEEITVVFNATIPVTGAEITIVGDVTGAGYAAIAGVDSGVVTTVPYTLPADTYTITVTHPSTGCELSTRYLVEEPVDHIVSVTPVSSVSCFGGNDGSVSFVIDTTTPYSGAYTYEVLTPALASLPTPITGIGTDASVAEVVSGLAAGDYVIRVTMTATPDCVRDSNVFTIAGPTATMVVTPTLNPISCIGGSDGSISVLATGGWGDYEYRLIDGTIAVPGAEVQAYSGSNLFENLDAGAYVIYVRDREGCELPTEVSLVDPTQVTFTLAINHNACSADGGVITVNAANGTGSYRYILLDAAGTTELRNQLDPNNSFVGLAAGDYNVRVEDSNGCGAAATQSATINPDLDFNINLVTLLDCVPNEGEYEIAITSGSNGDYTFDIQDSVPASVDNGTITAGNTTGNFNIPAGTPGTYSVIVTDVNSGCSITKPLVVAAAVVPTFTGAEVDAICEGESNGRIDITTTAGVIPVTYVATTNPGGVVTGSWDAGASAITGLPAGTYDVIGTGANGCTSLAQTFTIDDYDAVFVPALTVNAFNCTAGTNTTNSATLVFDSSLITGGSGNYTIALFDTNGTVATGNDTAITSGLSISGDIYTYTITDETGDDYYIRVVDNAGCENVSVSATLPAFERLTDITANLVTELDCNNEEEITVVFNATIPVTGAEITIVGDVTGAGYAAIAGVDSGVVTTVPYTLPADTYTITVTHPSTGCELSTRYLVEEPVDHIVSVTPVSSVSCFGGNDGSVSFVIDTTTPYSGAYTYEVLTPALASLPTPITGIGTDASVAEVVSGLAAGDYVIRVTMTATPDCVRDSNVFTIAGPISELVLNSELTYLKCTDPNSGEVNLTATGGWGAYEYQLEKLGEVSPIQSFGNNSIITGLSAGSYTATVRDINNCTAVVNFDLNAGTTITGVATVTPNVCNGETTATISVVASGGQLQDPTLTYSYILEYPDGTRTASQASNSFSGLTAGIGYHVLIADGYSCDGRVGPIDIVDPTEVVASANILADITCDPARSEATVEVTGSGGSGAYEYSSDGVTYSTVNIFSLPAGEHQLYVRDGVLCVSNPVTVTINPYIDLTATLDTSSAFITCNGDANAVLIANAQNGFGNYEYQLLDAAGTPITGWQTTNSFTGLNIGTYSIAVRSTNAAGDVCDTVTGTYTITEPLPLTGTAVATQNVTCFGGDTGIITAQGFDGNGSYEYNIVSVPANPVYPADKFVTNGVFENLPAATYYVTIKDITGCTIVPPIEVIITEPQELLISLVSVTEQVCLNDPSPTITVDVQGGTAPYYISINNVELATPYSQNQITLGAAEGIAADEVYVISVRDSGGGCAPKALSAITTTPPIDLALTVDFEYTCPTGNIIKAIVADAYKNNMSYTLYDGAGNAITTNTTGEFLDVAAGNGYTVTATHTISSCNESSSSSPIDIDDIQALTMTIDDSQKNKLIANVDFGLPPYNFTVDGVDYGQDNEFLILQTKDYTITVRDARGCEVTLVVNGVYVTIKVVNLFTPDGDGINDFWYPQEVEDYHNIRVYIFDRYARKITNFKGGSQGWDGTYEGKPLPAGDYWYTIHFNELSGEEKKIMGHFTLYR
ncbi:protein of unknown function [Tenacibaculum insulae]